VVPRARQGGRPLSVTDVMEADPIVLSGSAMVQEAARVMADRDIGAVLVVDDGGLLLGILTDRDIVVRVVAEGLATATCSVGEACTKALVTLSPSDTVDDALTVMRQEAVRRLPVASEAKPVGILTMADVARAEADTGNVFASIADAPATR
jgi:CBS domain-containing protein